ncbi:DNA mismatch repair protein MSH6 [Enteropsectra breve]|nr:DNA mismatch repair protein MSH6 [Enteropsectra breve]
MTKRTLMDYFSQKGKTEKEESASNELNVSSMAESPVNGHQDDFSEEQNLSSLSIDNVVLGKSWPSMFQNLKGDGKGPTGSVNAESTDPLCAGQEYCDDTGTSLAFDTFTDKTENGERYSFLLDVKDKNKIRRGEPGYDPSTLYIPEETFKTFTPFEKQFWNIKKEYFDIVICFKKGKFYELYEDDADIMARLFDFKVSGRVNMRMAGFPVQNIDTWVSKLLAHGYKVGRVDQTENMLGKKIREKEMKEMAAHQESSKIIERELKEILTIGTIYNDAHMPNALSVHIAAVSKCDLCPESEHRNSTDSLSGANEMCADGDEHTKRRRQQNSCCTKPNHYGVLLYDACSNKLYKKIVCDSFDLNNLRTIFIQNNVKEVISDTALDFCQYSRPDSRPIVSERKYDMPSACLHRSYAYLFNYMLGLCRHRSLEMAQLGELEVGTVMSLDGSTLSNLDVLVNNYDGTEEFSLYKKINHCTTPFGKRLLKKWLINPLTQIEQILKRRIDSEIIKNMDTGKMELLFGQIGDAERYLGRLMNLNSSISELNLVLSSIGKCSELFAEFSSRIEALDKCSIELPEFSASEDNLASLVEKDSHVFKLIQEYHKTKKISCEYALLKDTEHYHRELKTFIALFSAKYSFTGKTIYPIDKTDKIYRLSENKIKIEKDLEDYLNKIKNKLNCTNICYKSINNDLYQLEVPEGLDMPDSFYIVSATKALRRYYSVELKAKVDEYLENEERIFQAQELVLQNAVDFFKPHGPMLFGSIAHAAHLDCCLSFCKFNVANECVYPTFIGCESSEERLSIEGMRNPIYPKHIKNDFIPERRVSLLTGPNMGGKSTFLRGVCLNIILSQMGMGVTCSTMKLPIFDRIFTRIGASDSLARGESTFMRELTEVSTILSQSTERSFVIMDELGRGTSTRDGTAIAYAVLNYINKIGCYSLFTTHYHSLVEEYHDADKLHVTCIVENDDIVFLYKIKAGVCTQSHGIYIARIAGLPPSIITRAKEIRKGILENEKLN